MHFLFYRVLIKNQVLNLKKNITTKEDFLNIQLM